MNWKDLGGQLIKAGAPIIGTAIGGPVGGVIGSGLGTILANALGVEDTPEAVSTAIQNTPPDQLQAKLAAAESEAAAKWPALAEIAKSDNEARVAQAQIINETQRAEIAAGVSPWHWRHLIGYLVLAYGVMQLLGMVTTYIHIAAFAADPVVAVDVYAKMMAATGLFTGGLFALLGYVASDTTKLKTVAITGEQQPGVIEKVVGAVKPVVKKK